MCLLLVINYENPECRRLHCFLLTRLLPSHSGLPGKSLTRAVFIALSLKSFWLYTSSTNSFFPLVSPSAPLPQPPRIQPAVEHLSDCPQRQLATQVTLSDRFLMPTCQAVGSLESFVRTACMDLWWAAATVPSAVV